jgi:hypothetical protein
MISVIAHELTEVASDPLINAWMDYNGNENAGKNTPHIILHPLVSPYLNIIVNSCYV